jgi:hypothetical protein
LNQSRQQWYDNHRHASSNSNLHWGEVKPDDAAAWDAKRRQLYKQQRAGAAAANSTPFNLNTPLPLSSSMSSWWERMFGTSEQQPRSRHPAALPLRGRELMAAESAERQRQYRAKWQRRRRRALFIVATFGSLTALLSFITWLRPYLPQDAAITRAMYAVETTGRALVRIWRDVSTAVTIAADYSLSLLGETGLARERALHRVHARCAQRLATMMRANGGVYIKFGQHIAQLQHLLPDEYIQAMQPMLDQVMLPLPYQCGWRLEAHVH